jgi:hypothetical protein
MMSKHVTVSEWVSMFSEIGLDAEGRKQWHRLFEARHPDAHQAFLEWLGLSAEEIAKIRSESK